MFEGSYLHTSRDFEWSHLYTYASGLQTRKVDFHETFRVHAAALQPCNVQVGVLNMLRYTSANVFECRYLHASRDFEW